MHDSVKNTLSNRLAHGAWAMVFTKNDDIAIYCIELIIHCYNLKFLPTLVMVMIIIKSSNCMVINTSIKRLLVVLQ